MKKKNYIVPQMNVELLHTTSILSSSGAGDNTSGGFGGQTESGSGASKQSMPTHAFNF